MPVVGRSAAAEPGAPAERPVVAILEIEDTSHGAAGREIEKVVLDNLSAELRTKIAESGAFLVVDKGQQERKIKELAAELKTESYGACYDSACQIELGKALAASSIVATSITRLADRCTIGSRVVDVRREVTTSGVSVVGPCSEEGLSDSL